MKIYRYTFYGPHLHPQIRVEEGEPGVRLVRLYDPDDPAYRIRKGGKYDPWKSNPIGKQPVISVCVPAVGTREAATTEAERLLLEWFANQHNP